MQHCPHMAQMEAVSFADIVIRPGRPKSRGRSRKPASGGSDCWCANSSKIGPDKKRSFVGNSGSNTCANYSSVIL
jgi:hypothetical protein